MSGCTLLQGDCREVLATLPEGAVQTCVTSPPYWGLRDYGHEGQLGLEKTPDEYVASMVEVFRGVRRALRDDGTLWLNLGDSYAQGGSGGCSTSSTLTGGGGRYRAGSKLEDMSSKSLARKTPDGLKPKDLVGIPWRVAFALQADGWYLRSDIIWAKPNPMPESVTDRPTKAHEYLFLFAKSERYFYDCEAVKEDAVSTASGGSFAGRQGGSARVGPLSGGNGTAERWADIGGGRNRRSVWSVASDPYEGAHFATFPPKLIEPCVLAGSRIGDTVLDPFNGAGTTGLVALGRGRKYVGIELNPEYLKLTRDRLGTVAFLDAKPEDFSTKQMPLFMETA